MSLKRFTSDFLFFGVFNSMFLDVIRNHFLDVVIFAFFVCCLKRWQDIFDLRADKVGMIFMVSVSGKLVASSADLSTCSLRGILIWLGM